jgi:hypothetical protein
MLIFAFIIFLQLMKKTALMIFLLTFSITFLGQTQTNKTNGNVQNGEPQNFQIYPTQVESIYIKLDTRNGKMWQLNIGIDDKNNSESPLNSEGLVSSDKEVKGRFILQNSIFNFFILLDQIDGKVYKVYWALKEKNRKVVPVN